MIGSRKLANSFSANTRASFASLESSISITNSSPPVRATVSEARTAMRNLSATAFSTISPASCPCVSLTDLKPSRSNNITTNICPSRRAAVNACSRRSSNNRRLGNPVSESVNASLRISSSWRLESDISVIEPTKRIARPVSSQIAWPFPRTQTNSPLAHCRRNSSWTGTWRRMCSLNTLLMRSRSS